MSITTEIAIPARSGVVWSVLTDLPSYPRWNPFIRKAEGRLRKAERWRVELTIDGRVFFPVPTRITEYAPGRQLTWRGGLPGLMTGVHGFSVVDDGEGAKLLQTEQFEGVLTPAILPMLKGALARRFVEMNEALRSEVIRRSLVD